MKHIFHILVLTFIGMTCCNAGEEWLSGAWKFDHDKTVAELKKNPPTGQHITSLGRSESNYEYATIIPLLFDGTSYSFTQTNATLITKTQTNVMSYTILGRPSSSQAIVQMGGSNNKAIHFCKVSNYIAFEVFDGFSVYFSR